MGRDHSHYQDRDITELYLDPPPRSTPKPKPPKREARIFPAQVPHPPPPARQRPLANDPIHGGEAGPVESEDR